MDNLGAIDEDVHGALVHHVEVVPVITLLDDNLMLSSQGDNDDDDDDD